MTVPVAQIALGATAFALTRRHLFTVAGLALFLCFALRELRIGAAISAADQGGGLMLFPWGVFAVALWRLWRSEGATRATPWDAWALCLIALLITPLASELSLVGIGVAVGLVGLLTWQRSAHDPEMRAASLCLLALCANFTIARLVFRYFLDPILSVDMTLITLAIDLVGAPVTVTPAGMIAADGMRVALVGACSSFTGISAAILVHVGWAMALRTHIGWRDGIAILATVVVATLLNIIRLTLTASGHDGYAFWHGAAGENPYGAQLFWFAHNAILLAGGYVSASWARRPGAK